MKHEVLGFFLIKKNLRFWFSVWEGEGGEGTPVKSYRVMSYGGWGCESCTHIRMHACKHKELQLLELKFSFNIEGFLDFFILSEFKRHFVCGNTMPFQRELLISVHSLQAPKHNETEFCIFWSKRSGDLNICSYSH